MAPITFAAAPQDATVQQTAPVNEERNPQVGNYLACTISRKETAAELVDEERNPQVGNYLACIIASTREVRLSFLRFLLALFLVALR